jgi:hypothetical protein
VRRHASLGAVVISAVVAVLLPGIAQGYDECRGLRSCLSVVGPWVAVAPRADGGLISVDWEMRCPLAGYIVGGTDARVTSRAIRVTIRGEKGSPVSPGVTTRRSVIFTGAAALRGGRVHAFQPAIGCLRRDGGGGRSQTSINRTAGVFQPGASLVLRVATASVPTGATRTVTARCPRGARVVAGSQAVGFRTKAPPSPAALGGVAVVERWSATALSATVTVGRGVPRSVPVLVQVHVTCARGTP